MRLALRLLWALGLLMLLAAGLAAGWLWQSYQRFADAPLPGVGAETTFVFERGSAFTDLIELLAERGYSTAHPLFWKALALEVGADRSLRAGEYAIDPGTTPRQLLELMRQGRVVQHRLTIIEGWTFRELRAALAAHPALKQTLDGVDDAEVMARLGAPELHPEGQFLPETYLFPRGFSDLELLRRAHQALKRAKDEAWSQRPLEFPLSEPYELLILASIIEKETALASERERVAGVFVRRLQLGMRLQTDPTVIYGLGEAFTGRLRRVDLRTDTPYNTYTRHGLPPTPIAMPGRAALLAAANPAPGRELYFVARGDGSHHFSETYEQHREAVRRYVLGRG